MGGNDIILLTAVVNDIPTSTTAVSVAKLLRLAAHFGEEEAVVVVDTAPSPYGSLGGGEIVSCGGGGMIE